MAETTTMDRPSVAKPVSRPRSRKPATVSASALALHLDCSRTYIGKLEAEGANQRQGDGFPLDQSRVKTEMLQMRLMEKRRELVRRDGVGPLIDEIVGTVPTHLSGISARCSRDMQVRRNIDAVVIQIRREISEAYSKAADERNEPPLDEKH